MDKNTSRLKKRGENSAWFLAKTLKSSFYVMINMSSGLQKHARRLGEGNKWGGERTSPGPGSADLQSF